MKISNLSLIGLVAVLGLATVASSPALFAQDKKTSAPSEPENAGVSIWTQNVSGFRKEHGSVGGYKKHWDMSDMPHYVPKQQVTGILRIWGNNYLTDGPLGGYWVEAFAKFQPGVKIEYHLPTGTIAVSAVAAGIADIGMNYKATLSDRLIFEQVFHHGVTEIPVLTGSYDVYGWGPPGIIVVPKNNPLTQLTLKQLDGIFGGARIGGYDGSVWHTEYPYSRGPEENIRTWGQLGLTGEWADKPIHIVGQNLSSGAMLQFSTQVLMGSLQFAEGLKCFTNYITPDGKINSWSLQVRRELERDPYCICYVSPTSLSADTKELAIAPRDGGPAVQRTLETVHDRSYPLTHTSFFYINKVKGQPLDPKVEEFVRFVLSQEGQACVEHEGRYVPLDGKMVAESLKKIE